MQIEPNEGWRQQPRGEKKLDRTGFRDTTLAILRILLVSLSAV